MAPSSKRHITYTKPITDKNKAIEAILAADVIDLRVDKRVFPAFADEEDVIKALISTKPELFYVASDRLKDDETMLRCVLNHINNKDIVGSRGIISEQSIHAAKGYSFASERIRKDEKLLTEFLPIIPEIINYTLVELNHENIMLLAIKDNAKSIQKASEKLLCNKDFIQKAIVINPYALTHCPEQWLHNKEIIKLAVDSIKMPSGPLDFLGYTLYKKVLKSDYLYLSKCIYMRSIKSFDKLLIKISLGEMKPCREILKEFEIFTKNEQESFFLSALTNSLLEYSNPDECLGLEFTLTKIDRDVLCGILTENKWMTEKIKGRIHYLDIQKIALEGHSIKAKRKQMSPLKLI